ncbi:UDP-N-acetylglucosamine enolpyruvyl transferase [Bradyrhizobium sp. GM7.3]
MGGCWRATGIRESAALVIAGLIHNGESQVLGASALGRGYEDLPAKLRHLGAQISDMRENGAMLPSFVPVGGPHDLKDEAWM